MVDGRTYLRGKSPFGGVWYDTHTPYDIYEVWITLFNTIHMKLKYDVYTNFILQNLLYDDVDDENTNVKKDVESGLIS